MTPKVLWEVVKEAASRAGIEKLAPHALRRTCARLCPTFASGELETTSEVVREALRLLERQERERDEAFHQLKARLERGAAQAERGELLDGDDVFEELREMIEGYRRAKDV